jgi:hypothetical protein
MAKHDDTPTPLQLTLTEKTDLLTYFREELEQAMILLHMDSSAQTRSYVLHLLERRMRLDDEDKEALGFERPAAFMLNDALEAEPSGRIEAFRKLGDACLYNCGFFDARITRRSVSSSYYTHMGRDAYHSVADLMRPGSAMGTLRAIFAELAEKFDGFVAAFRHMATGQHPREELFARIRRGENVSVEELMRAGVLVGATGTGLA